MSAISRTTDHLRDGLLPARSGIGPLLQRDYWAAIARARVSPAELMDEVARRFCELPPPDLVSFARLGGEPERLAEGDELEVRIRMAGTFRVRVVHRDRQSLTLATLRGHPEAGRITFGAYRNRDGDVVFHIRSRARSSSQLRYAGFVTGGEAVQTNTWTDFVAAVALTCGEGIAGELHAETRPLSGEAVEEDDPCSPTFAAEGD